MSRRRRAKSLLISRCISPNRGEIHRLFLIAFANTIKKPADRIRVSAGAIRIFLCVQNFEDVTGKIKEFFIASQSCSALFASGEPSVDSERRVLAPRRDCGEGRRVAA